MKTIALFIFLMVISTSGLILYQYKKFNDGYLHIVFCDVGQGDAVFIRTPRGFEILYDGGPDQNVLSCLSQHMPFWERTLELILLSHPHADHLIGLLSVLKRYTVLSFASEKLKNETAMYAALHELLNKQEVEIRYVLSGDKFTIRDELELQVLGPTEKYLHETSPGGLIGESKEFASVIIHLRYGEFDALLSGDSQATGLRDARGKSRGYRKLGSLEVLQVPHHGSRTGLDREILTELDPKLAVISVGRNSYGHPSQEILRLLGEQGSKVMRTDKNGDIEIVTDGKTWWVR
jgi:competence protein ComEC